MNVDTWWYGFKEAEQLFYEGYSPNYNDFTSEYIWFNKGVTQVGIPIKDKQRATGAADYIDYYNKNFLSKA